jgi:hypothetical protein
LSASVLFPLYVVASKCSRDHFVSETHKTLQSFKLYFLHNIPSVTLYASASDCKNVGNIPGNHFVKTFSTVPSQS